MRYFIYILIITLAFNGCGTTGGLNLDEGVKDKSKYKYPPKIEEICYPDDFECIDTKKKNDTQL